MPKITKRVVDAAAPRPERFIIWDSELKGFGLLVLPTGVKSYVYNYRTPEGRIRRATIGRHGDWTAAEAREKAEEYRDGLKAGADPLAARKDAREALTVSDVLDLYLESDSFAAKADSTRAIDRGRIDRHLRPLLGKVYVHHLTEEDVIRARNAIRDGKTAATIKTKARGVARVRGGATTAQDTIALLRVILNWAVKKRVAKGFTENPAAHVEIGGHREREIILEDADAYRQMFSALDALEAERKIRAPVADAIRVIALTGARRGEIAKLRWRHLDGDRIVLPPEEHKGRRTGRPRVIGLPAAAREIIARQPAGGPDDFVFAPSKGEGAINLGHPWRKVRERAGLPAALGLHGLRHSVASHLAMSGAELAEIMAAVGHRQASTAVRYIHWADAQRNKLAERAAAPALAGMTGSGKADVVPLKGGKS